MSPSPSRYLALLRGINVGGRGKLAMAELVRLCEGAGCTKVRTYIQSGNVVFEATPAVAAALPAHLPVPAIVYPAAEMDTVVAGNPYPPEHSYVTFLFAPPERLPEPVPPEAWTLAGLHLYLFLPNGVAESKLAARLPANTTTRNWRTVLRLQAMLHE
jgi:uncharacterized protein (DUF1697 family)